MKRDLPRRKDAEGARRREAPGPAHRSRKKPEPIATAHVLREMQQRREDVMHAMQRLRDSWARARDWDQQLGETRAALAEAHTRFGEFYDFVPTPFLVLDEAFRIGQINAAGAAFLEGRTRFLGQPFVAFVAPDDFRRLVGALGEARVGDLKRLDVRLRSSAGWAPAQLTAKVSERSGFASATRLYYVALVDLSEIRRLEDERRRSADAEQAALAAAKAKDEFIAMLSHELRTPLTPILAAVDALRQADLSETIGQAVSIIRRNAVVEARLVDDLLDVARVTQKRLAIDPEPVSLHRLIDVVLADWAAEATRGGLDVRLELGAARDHVDADPGRIAQVLRNVLANALKFTEQGGRITVRTEDADEYVRVRVADNGRGMTAAEVARLFEPFAEAREQFGSRAGLGLGLVISHGIVAAHGGRIRVHSLGRGMGTTVEIELPTVARPVAALLPAGAGLSRDTADVADPGRGRERPAPRERRAMAGAVEAAAAESPPPALPVPAPAPASPRPPAADPAPGGRRRLLLVEDHEDSAETLSMVLSLNGYDVRVARNVREAEQMALGCDLVISDISLPDGSGLDLIRSLQGSHRMRGIALSGYGTEEDQRRSRDAGFSDHLTKPVDVDRLLAAVERVAAAV